jgi:hypothetical protein
MGAVPGPEAVEPLEQFEFLFRFERGFVFVHRATFSSAGILANQNPNRSTAPSLSESNARRRDGERR